MTRSLRESQECKERSQRIYIDQKPSPKGLIARRKRKKTENRREIKNHNYEENNSCMISSKTADIKKEEVLQTRCDCLAQDEKMSKVIRLHLRCFKKKIILLVDK